MRIEEVIDSNRSGILTTVTKKWTMPIQTGDKT